MKISASIKPNSKHREEVAVNEDGSLTVYTKAPAVEGRANTDAASLLARHFGVAKSRVKLVHGAASKQKIFEIEK